MADVHVKGLAELQAFLDALPKKVEQNILRGALREGANVIKEEAKANVPVQHGELRKSLRVSTRVKKGVVTASVKAGNAKAFYWRFVEFGTAAHAITGKDGGFLKFGGGFIKSLHHPGSKAKPFMRPALDSKSSQAVIAVGEAIKKRLDKHGIDTSDVEIELE